MSNKPAPGSAAFKFTSLFVAACLVGCASASRSGKDFSYDAAAEIELGMSKSDVQRLLGGEPVEIGYEGETGQETWLYEFETRRSLNVGGVLRGAAGLGLVLVGAPAPARALGRAIPDATAVEGQAQAVHISFREGIVAAVEYLTTDLDGQYVGVGQPGRVSAPPPRIGDDRSEEQMH